MADIETLRALRVDMHSGNPDRRATATLMAIDELLDDLIARRGPRVEVGIGPGTAISYPSSGDIPITGERVCLMNDGTVRVSVVVAGKLREYVETHVTTEAAWLASGARPAKKAC